MQTMNTPSAGKPAPNWALLAGLRFVLALIVVGLHINIVVGGVDGHLIDMDARAAVYGFLVLSGYSIAHSLRDNSKGYYWRRFWRIYPVYFSCLILTLFVHMRFGTLSTELHPNALVMPSTLEVIGSLFFVNGIVSPNIGMMAVSWTLACEVMFYLVAPLIRHLDIRGCVALYLVSLGIMLKFWGLPYNSLGTSPLIPLSLFWYWMAGWTFYKFPENKVTWVMLLGPPMAVRPDSCGGLGWVTFLIVVLTLIYSPGIKLSSIGQRCAAWCGDISYPLYLIHFPVIWWFIGQHWISDENSNPATKLPLLAAILICSIVLLHCVDYPCRKFAHLMYKKHITSSEKRLLAEQNLSYCISPPPL